MPTMVRISLYSSNDSVFSVSRNTQNKKRTFLSLSPLTQSLCFPIKAPPATRFPSLPLAAPFSAELLPASHSLWLQQQHTHGKGLFHFPRPRVHFVSFPPQFTATTQLSVETWESLCDETPTQRRFSTQNIAIFVNYGLCLEPTTKIGTPGACTTWAWAQGSLSALHSTTHGHWNGQATEQDSTTLATIFRLGKTCGNISPAENWH